MSEESLEQKQDEEETEDVEGHRRRAAMNDEGRTDDDDSDDVEAHRRRSL
jgi:hypothetical protein